MVEVLDKLTFQSHAGDCIFRVCRDMQALADEKQCRVECDSFNEFRLAARPGGDGVWLGINAFAGRLQRRDPAYAKSWKHPTDDDIVRVLTFSTALMGRRFLMDTALEKTDGDWGKAWDIVWAYRTRGTDANGTDKSDGGKA